MKTDMNNLLVMAGLKSSSLVSSLHVKAYNLEQSLPGILGLGVPHCPRLQSGLPYVVT